MTEENAGPSAADEAPTEKKRMPVWQESILLLVLAVVLAILVKTFLVQAFYIPSRSMEPGLEVNDRILVQKPSYWGSGEPERGDVIVFADPGGWLDANEAVTATNPLTEALSRIGLYPTGGHLVKRVIGVAGDTIHCCDDRGRLEINGVPLDSSDEWIENNSRCDGPMVGACDWTAGPVPDGELFVMGDHRDNSADSSYHLQCTSKAETCDASDAYVDVDLVVGKVFARVWPADRFGLVEKPPAFDQLAETLAAREEDAEPATSSAP
ncbi:signal peptidase I [Nocardioides bruguierae]|uniref:signal peptidase I n=1 Tax=Nocardioides bruguierae TaxID=2945102 RepID=UPI0020224CE0|nr:signal peptidase I [Nocardioides bruguierae]MCL8024838.1 signal peptidase I [Nocardioides bruguierae]